MNVSARDKAPRGLYDAAYEHDACGVAFVARLRAPASHEVVERALEALERLEHRGAAGADAETGDGAGILLQIPDAFLRAELPFELPAPGRYGVAMCFLPRDPDLAERARSLFERTVADEGQHVLGWRSVPVDLDACGRYARACAPRIEQLFVAADDSVGDQDAFERRLYVIRRVVERAGIEGLAIPSFSSRTVVYKGMLTAPQLPRFYADLRDPRVASRLAIVHSRFSTNTFPSWELAHPYRMLAHNGEINTLRGNRNWMRARESQLASLLFGDDIDKIRGLLSEDLSDSASLDRVFELLVLGGRSPAHAITMLIPEAYEKRPDTPPELRDFYAYHESLIEPWDGPAAVAFTDGRVIGATLDRNGLRPGRWLVTRDGWVVVASETGVFDCDPADVEAKGRLRPGKLFLVDLEADRIVPDEEVKRELARRRPYGKWLAERVVHIDDLPDRKPRVPRVEPLRARQLAFGWSEEDLRAILAPMACEGSEPTGSMGNDTALAVLSDQRPSLFRYFKQLFAQVTNPAIDPIRESVVMSLKACIGPEVNLLDETPEHCHQLVMPQPILRNGELERLRQVDHQVFWARTIDITWPVAEGPAGMERRLEEICDEAAELVRRGVNILILSDRNLGAERAPIPALLATSAVHHRLVREGTRLRTGLVVETGEAREVHHIACLIGYGAAAVNPYLMFESLSTLKREGWLPDELALEEAEQRVIKAIGKGLLKILSKMGISTIASYTGAQIFEAVGLDRELVDRYFTGTPSRVGGVGLQVLAREALDRHARAYPAAASELLPHGGIYQWRRDGEFHGWNPETIANLQHAARREGTADAYERFARYVNEVALPRTTLRGLLRFRSDRDPIPIDEVEPTQEILKRFKSGGMSLGALSPEAHETLAVAMNRLGGKSNTGEGGEDPARWRDERRSSIKQVASGRFGVTIHYLVNSDEIQIKIAQGAKPGEGGQLPGHKVNDYIAKLRHSTPGVGLISPPPHHDIYSIEDLKQLIYDLRCANPRARISVKLVAEVGVGTVAAGVAKANADHVVIAGHDGGTGASPLSSIQHAGIPWEIGLAETQQTLLRNDLRSRILVEVDGQMRTGRDVVVAAILGADEFGFSTAPLIALGCVMMRVCHLNTCPVGVATQDPVLRERFAGQPEHVVNYLWLVAEEARRIMASLGVRTMAELIGRTELLEPDPAIDHWKARGLDLRPLLAVPDNVDPDAPRCCTGGPDPQLDDHTDRELIAAARAAIDHGQPVQLRRKIRNPERTVGGLLSSEIARVRGFDALPDGTIEIVFEGSAGQSFGAWLAPGVTFVLEGDANDYAGKGLSGGTIVVRPPAAAPFAAERNVVVGNVVLYGATSGKAFFRGLAGERFCVRNSGAIAVVEGCGDHGCEYMTGGRVVVLGPTGINFAAGMSGGIAYVLDVDGRFRERCNTELVGFDEITPDEALELRGWIEEHERRTGSTVARAVLDDWEGQLGRFVKVMPHDYKRALAELADRRSRLPSEAPEPLAVGAVAASGDGQGTALGDGAAADGPEAASQLSAEG
ncbi:glutamate synthase large subunit [Thermoleophilum album]|uniref:glutamate synthase large subunit n=1 Tax=Thermoleophilum album TaxID=29539 RepID=UPI00237C808D|nr:glutamate synthase large subunit [Thermoleophilum album]WDT93226.1 glutamate synthase large subunit [Thermoleophilum album]